MKKAERRRRRLLLIAFDPLLFSGAHIQKKPLPVVFHHLKEQSNLESSNDSQHSRAIHTSTRSTTDSNIIATTTTSSSIVQRQRQGGGRYVDRSFFFSCFYYFSMIMMECDSSVIEGFVG